MSRQVPLATFVPRGAIEWLAEQPDRRHQVVDGSLVFVDLSGFTALSERLARLGKVGAEEVTAVLNTVFNGLLSVAYADGGSLLKFGGDALLLFYTGDDHALHACRAAARMRAHLRGLNPLGSSAGNVQLRMTIGVHSGPMEQFLVGSDRHRDLVLAGPATSAVVRAESSAKAGEILVTPATAELLTPGTAQARPDGLHRLRRGPDAGPFIPPIITEVPAGTVVGPLLSRAVHDRLVQGVDEGEHRQAVIAFVKFTGADTLLAQEGAEALADAVEELVTTIQAAADRYGVSYLASDIDADGGKIILLGGVPTASEFDGEQMLRAVGDVSRSGCRLPVQVGVHHGRVFAGVIGPRFRLTYTVIGDAVNLAARVMARAEPGQVLATAEALSRSQVLFELDEIPPFAAKGKAKPVRAHVVGRVTATRVQARRARLPLIGRDAELAELVDRLDQASHGNGQAVILAGEAGLGKSRLIAELQERRPDIPFVTVAAQRYERNTAYYVVDRLLRTLLGLDDERLAAGVLRKAIRARAPDLVPLTPLVGDALGVQVEDTPDTALLQAAFRAERTAEVVASLMARCLPDRAVLVLEDVHWLDEESLRALVHFAAAHLPNHPRLVLATARARLRLPTALGEPTTIELKPLGPEAVRELTLAAAEQGMVSLDQVDRMADRSSGNPLFLEELVTGADGDEDLPDSLETLVQARMDRLDAPDRDRLRIAAVLGQEFDLDLLTAIAGPEVGRGDDGAWKRLRAFLEPTGGDGFRFRHALVQDAAYGALPYRRRRELHEQAAQTLQRRHAGREEEIAELLALHFYNAGRWDQAWRYNRLAADAAQRRYANVVAATHLRRALQASRYLTDVQDSERASVWEALGDALHLAGNYAEADRAFTRARRLAAAGDLARLCRKEGEIRERLGRYSQSVYWYRRGLKAVPVDAIAEPARLIVNLALVRLRQGQPGDALDLAEDSLALASRTTDPGLEANGWFALGWAAEELAKPNAQEHYERALRLYRQAGELIGEANVEISLGIQAYYKGRWNAAVEHYERAGALRLRAGDESNAAAAMANVGEVRSNQGRFEEAAQAFKQCLPVFLVANHAVGVAFVEMNLGRACARAGEYEEAERRLSAAASTFAEMGAGTFVLDARTRQAELALFRGGAADCLQILKTLVDDVGTERGAIRRPFVHRLAGCAALLLERHDEAAARLGSSLAAAREANEPYEVAMALTACIALAAHRGEAPETATVEERDAILGRLGVTVEPDHLVLGPTRPRLSASR